MNAKHTVKWLRSRGWPISIIARVCGVHESSVKQWDRGDNGARPKRMAALQRMMQLTDWMHHPGRGNRYIEQARREGFEAVWERSGLGE